MPNLLEDSFAALAVLILAAAPAPGQPLSQPEYRGAAASIGGSFTTTTGVTGPTGGAMVRLASLVPRRVGFEVGLGYLAPSRTHAVFPRYSAASADLGVLYPVPRSGSDLLLRAGGSFLLNGHGAGDLGPYLGLGLIRPLSDRLGLRFDVMGRYWLEGPGLGVGAEAGLAWLTARRISAQPGTPPLAPSGRPAGWSFGGFANLIAARSRNVEGLAGPMLQIARLSPGGLGFEAGLTYIAPVGRYDFTGLGLDLGLAYGQPVGRTPLLLLRGGLSLVAGGDNDGGGGGAAAVAPGLGLMVPLGGRVGLRVDTSPRFWLTGGGSSVTLGASVGLVLLPRSPGPARLLPRGAEDVI